MSRALDRGQQPIAPGALGDGSQLTDLNASELKSGTVGTARLGSGTADSGTFLRGDNTWQAISVTPTTAQVLAATAGAGVGEVGTYALMNENNTNSRGPGATLAGSSLRYVGLNQNSTSASESISATVPAGTWRVMGNKTGTGRSTVWLRIS